MLEEKLINNLCNILSETEHTKIAVAVSGGADSIALMHLMINIARTKGISVTILSVDHNLRNESKNEMKYIKSLANVMKVDCAVLSWQAGYQLTAMQERARKGRYNLMTKYCRENGITILMTAHHLDDMLESFIMKKTKKLSTLALMPNVTYFWDNIMIVRPLYNISKLELINYLIKYEIKWFEDASNKSEKYARNRIRKCLNELPKIDKIELFNEYYKNITKAEHLNDLLIQAIAEGVCIYKEGFAKIKINYFNNLIDELKIHLLNYILTIISGKIIIPRYRNLEKILVAIADIRFKKTTLSYCNIINEEGNLIIFKEKKFIKQKLHINENFGSSVKFDSRFDILNLPNGFYVTSLTMADYLEIKEFIDLKKLAKDSDNKHKSILFTIPVIKTLEKVIAIPHISYYSTKYCDIHYELEEKINNIKVIFSPSFISRFTHFF